LRDVRFTLKNGHVRCNSLCPPSANSGLEVIKPFQEMARFDRCQIPAALESGVALPARATSPPFYGEKQRSLSPRVQPSRYTHRRIADTALPSDALALPTAYAAFPITVSKCSHSGHWKVCSS